MSITNYTQLIKKIENFNFSKLPLKKIYNGKMNNGEIWKLIFNKEELDFMDNAKTYADFEGYNDFITLFEKKLDIEMSKFEKNLPKRKEYTQTFVFRSLRNDIIDYLKTILKKEYPIKKMWTEEDEGYLYLNCKIFAGSFKSAEEICSELEQREEEFIEEADEKTRCPINPVWTTGEHLAKQYRQIDDWYNRKTLLSIKPNDKKIKRKINSMKNREIRKIFKKPKYKYAL